MGWIFFMIVVSVKDLDRVVDFFFVRDVDVNEISMFMFFYYVLIGFLIYYWIFFLLYYFFIIY